MNTIERRHWAHLAGTDCSKCSFGGFCPQKNGSSSRLIQSMRGSCSDNAYDYRILLACCLHICCESLMY